MSLEEPRDLREHVRAGLSDREVEGQLRSAVDRWKAPWRLPWRWMMVVGIGVATAAALITSSRLEKAEVRPPPTNEPTPRVAQPPVFAPGSAPADLVIAGEEARPADLFADSVGIQLWVAEDQPRADWVTSRLAELGVRHVIHSATSKHGAKFTHAAVPRNVRVHVMRKDHTLALPTLFERMGDRLAAVHQGWTFDKNWRWRSTMDAAWAARVRDNLQALWQSRRPGIAIVGPSVRYPFEAGLVGDLSPWVDMGSFSPHNAPQRPGVPYLDEELAGMRRVYGDKPMVTESIGYCTGPGIRGVSEAVQARYLARVLLEHFNRGIVRTFIEGLLDRKIVQRDLETLCGLVRADGTPKPSFAAIQALIEATADPGSGAAASGRLSYQIEDAPPELHRTLLVKRDGRFLLILWLEIDSADGEESRTVRLTYGKTTREVAVSDAPVVVEIVP